MSSKYEIRECLNSPHHAFFPCVVTCR
uniref:Uncharacterized protein n=1 Tax=Arundo donax TaxID=35708 RepID=A0A0A9H612_ARUDO